MMKKINPPHTKYYTITTKYYLPLCSFKELRKKKVPSKCRSRRSCVCIAMTTKSCIILLLKQDQNTQKLQDKPQILCQLLKTILTIISVKRSPQVSSTLIGKCFFWQVFHMYNFHCKKLLYFSSVKSNRHEQDNIFIK